MHLAETILFAVTQATLGLDANAKENTFQKALATTLGQCERELPACFDAPKILPRLPPQTVIEELKLPPGGKDPCVRRPKLDILWHSPTGLVPIELKFCGKRKADTNGYQFLKDLHRLERMVSAGQHKVLAEDRFAVFATCEPVYWRGMRPEPKPFWLSDGRLPSGYWVQYDQKSAITLWKNYPPFFLANSYELTWRDLHANWRCLLVHVKPQ